VVDHLEVRNLSTTTAFRAGLDLKIMRLLSEFKPIQPQLPSSMIVVMAAEATPLAA